MHRLPFFRTLSSVALAVAVSGCKTAPTPGPTGASDIAVAATPLRIAFVPPDGKLLQERSTTTRTEGEVTERIEATMTSRYDRLKEAGWALTQWVPKLEISRNGAKVESPLVELVTRFPVKVQLAVDGAFVRLMNPEDAEAAIQSTFPDPVQAATWLHFFSAEAIEQQSRREWESKYAGLFNRNLREGAKLYSLESLVTGETPRYFLVERTLSGRTQSPFGEAAVFTLRCSGDAKALQQDEGVARLLKLWGDPELEPSVQCEGQQLIAISPFVPTRSWLRVTAKPSAETPEVTMHREVSALELK